MYGVGAGIGPEGFLGVTNGGRVAVAVGLRGSTAFAFIFGVVVVVRVLYAGAGILVGDFLGVANGGFVLMPVGFKVRMGFAFAFTGVGRVVRGPGALT